MGGLILLTLDKMREPVTHKPMREPSRSTTPATDALDDVTAHFQDVRSRLLAGVPDSAAAELTVGQLRLLSMLLREDPATMGEIAEWLVCGRPFVTESIDRLVAHGLVERSRRIDDRRFVEARLTDQGRELLEDIQGVRTERLAQVVGFLEPTERRDLDGCSF